MEEVLRIYLEVGSIACETGNLPLADSMFKAALQMTAGNTKLGDLLNRIASIYIERKMFRKAETLYKRALATYSNLLGPNNPHTSTVLDLLAELAIEENKLGQAEQYFRRGQKADETFNNYHTKSERLRKLALVYYNRGKNSDAHHALTEARRFQELASS